MTNKELGKGKILFYKNRVEVTFDTETVWLNQRQMADLFQKDLRTVNEHISNVYKERELQKKPTIRNFRIVQKEGSREVTRNVDFYSLDVIISVGYRVKSKQGTQFRIWATNVLRKHLINGYTLNEKRLKNTQQKYQALQKSIQLLDNVAKLDAVTDETKGLIQVLSEYTKALDLLDDFDHENLSVPKGTKKAKYELTYEKAQEVIAAMKAKFKDSDLVGQEKDHSFRGSLGAIYQTSGGQDVYPTVEEKAAHLLYFVTKNHSFIDGNKRIAAALFICFLQRNSILLRKNGEKRIDNNSLVALTLMIAASNPAEKEMLIKIVLNVLK